jgi:TP901 family phage tail tape measure protein
MTRDAKAGGAYVEVKARDSTGEMLAKIFNPAKWAGYGKTITQGLKKGISSSVKGVVSTLVSGITSGISGLASTLPGMLKSAFDSIYSNVELFATFDDTMRKLGAVTSGTADDFAKLRSQAEFLGRTTSSTAQQIGEIQVQLGKAGFARKEILKMTDAVRALGRATDTEAASASGILSATLRQYALGAEHATHVSGALTKAANGSFNSLGDLGEALRYAGPVAEDFNVSLEESLAVLMALGNLDIRGSAAGTSLRNMLLFLSSREDMLGKLLPGMTARDAAGNLRPLQEILVELQERTKDMGTAERADIFSKLFGVRAIVGARGMVKSIDQLDGFVNDLINSTNEAIDTSNEMDAGIGGALRSMGSAIEGIRLAVGEMFAPLFQSGADALGALTNTLTTIVKQREPFLAFLMQAKTQLGELTRSIYSSAQSIIAYFTPLANVGSTILQTFKSVGDALSAGEYQTAIDVAAQGIKHTWEGVKSFLGTVWDDLVTNAFIAFENIKASLAKLLIDLHDKIRLMLSGIFLDIAKGANAIALDPNAGPLEKRMALGTSMMATNLAGSLSSIDASRSEGAKEAIDSDRDRAINELLEANNLAQATREAQLSLSQAAFDEQRKSAEYAKSLVELQQGIDEANAILDLAEAVKEETEELPKKLQQTQEAISTTLPQALEKGSLQAAEQSYANKQVQHLAHLVKTGQLQLKTAQNAETLLQQIADSQALGVG